MCSKKFILFFLVILLLSLISYSYLYSKNLTDDEQFIKAGIGAYRDGLFEISEKQFEIFLKEYPNHPKIFEVSYLLGKSLFNKGKYSEAKNVFSKIINDGKNFDFIDYCFFWVGFIELKLGNIEEARKNLLILIKNFPKFDLIDYTYYFLGIINFKLNRLSQAESSFKKVIQLSKKNELVLLSLFWIGITSFKDRNFEASSNYFKKVLEDEASLPESYSKVALFWYGENQIKLKNFYEAKKIFKTFSERFKNDPLLPDAFFKIGYCEFRLNHFGEALKTFQSFQEQFKDLPFILNTRYILGRILNTIGDYPASNREINFILTRKEDIPLRGFSLLILFCNYINLGQIEESNRIFQRIQKMNHSEELKIFSQWINAESMFYSGKILDSIPYYFNLLGSNFRERSLYKIAKGYFFENKFREALTNIDILLFEFPNSNYFDEILFIKGECLIQLGSLDQALEIFNGMVEKKRNPIWSPIALTRIGTIYQLKMYNDKAIDVFRRIIDEYPYHPLSSHAAIQLGNLFFRQKKMSEAIIYFTLVLKGNLSDLFGQAYFAIGEIFFSQGRYDKAQKSFQEALRYLSTDSLLFFLTQLEIGNLHRIWGNYEDAKRSYQIILSKSKDDEIKKVAKEFLSYIESF